MTILELGSFYSDTNVDGGLTKTERWECREISFGTFSKKSKATAAKTSKVKLNTPSPAPKEKNEDEKSFWEKYKKIILITTGIVLVGAAVVTVIILTAGTATPIAGSAMGSGLAAIAEGLDEAEHPTVLPVENVARSLLEKPKHVSFSDSTSGFGSSIIETFDTNILPIDSFKPNYFPTNLEPFWMNNMSSSGMPTKELPQHNEAPVLEQPELVYPSCLKRNLPIFTSDKFPTVKTWGQWFLDNQYMDYLADSEVVYPHNNTSMTFRTPGEYQQTMRIGGINGLGNDLKNSILHSEYVKKFAGDLAVEWVYNCSNSSGVDVVEAATINMHGYSPNTANLLRENWAEFHNENKNNPHAKYFQVCHSQGAIHVRNALEKLPIEIRDRIIVVAIAPAAVIPKELCYQSYNYVCTADAIPYSELAVACAGLVVSSEQPEYMRIQSALDRRQELIFLEPHPEVKGMNHNFQSLTYQKILFQHFDEYLKKRGIYK